MTIVGLAREGAWNLSDVSEAEKAPSTMALLQIVIKIVQVLGLRDRNLRCSPAIYKPCDLRQATSPPLKKKPPILCPHL